MKTTKKPRRKGNNLKSNVDLPNEQLIGKGISGKVFKVHLNKLDKGNVIITNYNPSITIIARKKYHKKKHWQYELINIQELYLCNSTVLKKIFAISLEHIL